LLTGGKSLDFELTDAELSIFRLEPSASFKGYAEGPLLPAPVNCAFPTSKSRLMPAKSAKTRRIDAPVWGTQPDRAIDQLCINTIRTLAMDAVQQANSGHPGTPMALAPLVYTLWQNFLRFDPADPIWPNRDRFVLSNGHASMLLYAMLHLSGVKAVNAEYERLAEPAVSLDDIKQFRQLGSKCPGHPEYHVT
jgi:hypothetical protein